MEATEETFGPTYPPKPLIAEKQGSNLLRSLLSLFVYAALFYFLFERNIAYIAAVLLVLLIHEFGHFFAMKLYNYQNVKLFIIPLMGAFVSGKKQTVSQRQMSIIILAGPVPGLLIGTILFLVNRGLDNDTIKMLSNVFIFINLFNMLPIFPLDGGRFLENLFIKNNHGIRLVFTILSVVFLLILLLITLNFVLLIVPALMIMELLNEVKNQKIREYLDQEKISYQLDYSNLPDKSYWLIRDCVLFSFRKKYNGVEPGVYQYSIAEPMLIQHVMSILRTDFNHDLKIAGKMIFLFVYLLFLIGLPIASLIMVF